MAKVNGTLRVLGGFSAKDYVYQNPVEAIQTDATLDPGASPTEGDRYILTDVGNLNANFGTITGVANGDIVEYQSGAFIIFFDASAVGEGAITWSKADDAVYQYNGTTWGTAANPDGGDGITFNGGSNRYDIDLATSSGLELTAADGTGELQIAASGVTEARIADDAVTAAKIATDAVTSDAILADAVGSAELADNAVDTNAIQDSAVNSDKLATDSVTSDEIAANAVGTAEIDALAVTDAKIATGVDAVKIGAGTVDNTEFGHLNGVTSAIQTQLDAKQALSEKNAANGYAGLDANGKIASTLLPAIAVTEVFTVADITARDALTVGSGDGEVQEGDVSIVTDASADPAITSGAASYIYKDGTGWLLLKAGDEVLSVNGATGAVTVNAINELTGDVTAGPASGSSSAAATISANAVTETKIADDAVTSGKLATDAVGDDALNYASTGLRSASATDAFSSLTRTFTHNWGTTDVIVDIYDSVTGETCLVDLAVRTSNAVAITVAETPANSLTILLREVNGSQTSLTVS